MTEDSKTATGGDPANPVERQGFQKFDLRLFADVAPDLGMDEISNRILEIFGRWRLEEGEELMDLADYAHVPEGPGILLIGHRWQFGVDWANSKPSLFYSSRKGLSGDLSERLGQALSGLFQKSARLLGEDSMATGLTPQLGELEIAFNDRLSFPNNPASDKVARPAVDAVLAKLYVSPAPTVVPEADKGRRLAYRVSATGGAQTVEELGQRI